MAKGVIGERWAVEEERNEEDKEGDWEKKRKETGLIILTTRPSRVTALVRDQMQRKGVSAMAPVHGQLLTPT